MSNLASFTKNFLFSYTNQIFLLLNGLLYTYIIANYLGPDNYGVFIYLFAFVTNTAYIFGLESIIETLNVFIAKFRSEILFSKTRKITLVVSITICLGLLLVGQYFVENIDAPAISVLRYISITVIMFPLSLVYNSLFRGFKMFGKVLKIAVLENMANLILAFAFVILFDFGIMGAVYAKLMSLALALIASHLFSLSIKYENKSFEKKEVIKYAKISFFTNFVKRATAIIKLFFIGLFINPVMMGFYYLLEKISAYAINIPSASINEVFIPYLGEKADDMAVLSSYASLNFKAVALLASGIGVAIFFLAPIILPIIFPAYSDAVSLVPYFTITIILSSFTGFGNLYRIMNRNDFLLTLSFISLINTVIIGYFLISYFGVIGLILIEAVRQIVSFPFHYLFLKKLGVKIDIFPTRSDYIIIKRLISPVFGFRKNKGAG
ncbi:MAG: oligosaccharide flippase family protein [archaeon]|nr:oligosaccharide flippase family protein [archaeon]